MKEVENYGPMKGNLTRTLSTLAAIGLSNEEVHKKVREHRIFLENREEESVFEFLEQDLSQMSRARVATNIGRAHRVLNRNNYQKW